MLVAMVMSGEVDVVDNDEDEEVVQRPARVRTKTPSPPAAARDQASHGFPDVGSLKDEEMHGIDDFDLSSGDEESAVPTKRKAAEISQDDAITDHANKIKQIKIEDDDSPDGGLEDITPADKPNPPVAGESKRNEKGQFHWALEDDDDDDSDNENQPNRTTTAGANLPSPPRAPDPEGAGRVGIYDMNAEEGEEELYEYEEEDEELEMNVGKVYEKTLVQLGQILGESLVDD